MPDDHPALARDVARVQAWFAKKGLRLIFSSDADGVFWADLVQLEAGQTVWPRYGRGISEADAAVRAGVRYMQEQE